MSFAHTNRMVVRLVAAWLLLLCLPSQARLGVEYQMPLGDPSGATADANNHEHYLIQRRVFAMDYDDRTGEPNWVSWDLTAEDMGPAKRSPGFKADAELPAGFHHITSADYKQSGFDRGHMCPSADRTDDADDNGRVFVMSNIIPQAPDNNQGVWEKLESDCRDMAKQGNELLIICGPAGFSSEHIGGGVMVPSHTWKIVVEVPEGPGPVLSRITAATRVIAVDIPNHDGVRHDPWQKYLVSVNQLEALTGLKFFTALAPDVASVLKAKVDGQAMPAVTAAETKAATDAPTPRTEQQGKSLPKEDWMPYAIAGLTILFVGGMVVLILFFRGTPRG